MYAGLAFVPREFIFMSANCTIIEQLTLLSNGRTLSVNNSLSIEYILPAGSPTHPAFQKGVPAMPTDTTRRPQTNIAIQPNPNLADQIRRRAYELYEERGREEGHELEDWLRAEEEVRGRRVRDVTAN